MDTPTNDAPVTVNVTQDDRDAAADYFAAIGDHARAKVARRGEYDLAAAVQHFSAYRHRLAALASAPAEPLPDIGPDPFKGPREDDRYEGSRLRLRAAYAQQQKGVPDQTALVWRYDLGTVLEMAIRLKSILADDEEPASAPAGDAREVLAQAYERANLICPAADVRAKNKIDWVREAVALDAIVAALARPRAVVGEQSREAVREAVAKGLAAFIADEPDYAMSNRMIREATEYIMAQPGIFALQSPLAKVEG